MTLLLNPRVWIAFAIAGIILFLYTDGQTKGKTIVRLEGEKALLLQENKNLGEQIVNLQKMVSALKANLEAARKSVAEMQKIKDEANALRRRIIELQNQPGVCEDLKVEYEKIARDITVMFNDRLRRKIGVPKPGGDRAAPEVLPGPASTDSR